MPYYKFVKETDRDNHTVLRSCLEGNLKFSLYTEMKDQSETHTNADMNDVKKTLKHLLKNTLYIVKIFFLLNRQIVLAKRIYGNLGTLFNILKNSPNLRVSRRQICLKNLPYLIIHYLPITLEIVNKDIQERIGILCITKEIRNERMWEKYADNAKGFVVEYNDLESVFTGDGTGVFDEIRKINYVDGEKRPALRLSKSDFDRLFFTKLKDTYSFEKEYRVIKVLYECKSENGGYFITIDPEKYISRIIVGWNKTPEEFEEIKDFVNKHSSIPVVQAFANGDHIETR